MLPSREKKRRKHGDHGFQKVLRVRYSRTECEKKKKHQHGDHGFQKVLWVRYSFARKMIIVFGPSRMYDGVHPR